MAKEKVIEDDLSPEISINDGELISAKYTSAGIQRYKQTIKSYSKSLFNKAILIGELDKADGYDREITEHHVRKATIEMTNAFSKTEKSAWIIFCQAGEYLCTGVVGVGASNLKENWGTITFGLGLVIGIALFVFRMTKVK